MTDKQETESDLPNYLITKTSFLNMQVCSRLGQDETVESMRKQGDLVSGTSLGWILSDRENCGPVTCEKFPNRTHYLFDC